MILFNMWTLVVTEISKRQVFTDLYLQACSYRSGKLFSIGHWSWVFHSLMISDKSRLSWDKRWWRVNGPQVFRPTLEICIHQLSCLITTTTPRFEYVTATGGIWTKNIEKLPTHWVINTRLLYNEKCRYLANLSEKFRGSQKWNLR